MNKSITAVLLAGAAALSGCMTNAGDRDMAGPPTASPAPVASIAEGAVAGNAIGGLINAVWADQNNDGVVDGYVWNGSYYPGLPQGYDAVTRSVAGAPPAPGPMTAPEAVTPQTPPEMAPAPATMPPAPASPPPPTSRGERG